VRAGGIERRLRRLEERGCCTECGLPPDGPRKLAVISEERPEKSFDGNPHESCSACGQALYCVIRVVYDGEGVSPIGQMRGH
jgi:hypothetical protein